MTQTLTTEKLQGIYEAAVHVEATLNDPAAEFELLCKLEDVGGVGATIRRLIDMVRVANREAQPVVWDYEWASCITCDGPQNFKHVIEREAPPKWAIDEGQARNVTPLYTIPPAPAVPRVTEIPEAATLTNINQLCPLDNNLSQTDFATGWNDCRQYALTHDGLPPVIKGVHAAAQGWNACRAAMLAQPVVIPVEPTAAMQAAGAAAIRLDTTAINKLFTANAVYRAMLAAAPEVMTK